MFHKVTDREVIAITQRLFCNKQTKGSEWNNVSQRKPVTLRRKCAWNWRNKRCKESVKNTAWYEWYVCNTVYLLRREIYFTESALCISYRKKSRWFRSGKEAIPNLCRRIEGNLNQLPYTAWIVWDDTESLHFAWDEHILWTSLLCADGKKFTYSFFYHWAIYLAGSSAPFYRVYFHNFMNVRFFVV